MEVMPMNDQAYVDQSALDLNLTLLENNLPTDKLNILKVSELEIGSVRARAGIIGASHFCSFGVPRNDISLHEVFSCKKIDTNARRMFYGPIGDIPAELTLDLDEAHYTFTPSVHEWGDEADDYLGDFENRVRLSSESAIGLQYRFPSKESGGRCPKTIVCLQSQPDRIFVETAHTYPNENTIVITETKLQTNTP